MKFPNYTRASLASKKGYHIHVMWGRLKCKLLQTSPVFSLLFFFQNDEREGKEKKEKRESSVIIS